MVVLDQGDFCDTFVETFVDNLVTVEDGCISDTGWREVDIEEWE